MHVRRTLPASIDRRLLRAGLLAALVAGMLAAGAQPSAQQPKPSTPAKAQAKPPQPPASRVQGKPLWAELTPDQQHALRPLAPSWNGMSEGHKRKWLAMSQNFRSLSPDEQAKLQTRMTEWSALSPQQRTQARLNFAEAKRLTADERKAKWEAYQALSPEEKRKLAAGAPKKTPPTAAAVRPIPPQKLARVPHPSAAAREPRIAAGPAVPQHVAPAPAPVPAPVPTSVPTTSPAPAAVPVPVQTVPQVPSTAPMQPVTQEN
ncbi:DUF3106 domain-containing protein [Ramlibacter sp. MMS24-I3-19]|uniref:DUF3106 domain-containing protein n=1 Tax=Ramlibacter sp. MMS24-I3-19 TaxID=3416606 RepID=UPI003CFDFFF2